MGRGLVREINSYLKHAKGFRDTQASKITDIEHDYLKQKLISPSEANKIVKKLERHWGILINQIYPEYDYKSYDESTMGEAWPVSRRAAAINIPLKYLRPYALIHEASHGVTECCRYFHTKNLKEPGHGPLWCGVYAYNMQYASGINIRDDMINNGINVVEEDVVHRLREFFKNA